MAGTHSASSRQATDANSTDQRNGDKQAHRATATNASTRGVEDRSTRTRDLAGVRDIDRIGNAEEVEKEAGRRWIEYGFLVDEFDTRTKVSRSWYTTGLAHKSLRETERARLAKEIPKLERELLQAHEELRNMEQADRVWEARHGQKCEQGEYDCMKLEKYRGYLKLEHDEVPDLK